MFHFEPKTYPEHPGVYRMLDAQGLVIYIGKAKDLRKRLSQYFSSHHDGRYQIDLLLRDVAKVETISASSEKDALILENQLIKREKPKYNIRLKDDKTYPYIRLSKDEFPRVEVSRERDDENYLIFGPYTVPSVAHRLVEMLSAQFGLRRCPGVPLKMLERPCLYAQIGQCSAPCVKKIDGEQYSKNVQLSLELLNGKTSAMMREAKNNMLQASEDLAFERAAYFRDLWKALQNFERGAVLEGGIHQEVDVFSNISHRGFNVIALLQVRSGELWNSECFFHRAMGPLEEDAGSFLLEVYAHRQIPKRIVLDFEVEDLEVVQNILIDKAGFKLVIHRPQRGELLSWLSMARQNARAEVSCREATGDLNQSEYLLRVQIECDLPRSPHRAIALDCANFSKEEPVGSVVVFVDGRPDKSLYRKFKIRGEAGEQGDVYHVEEVLTRYLKKQSEASWPDVILIDGGVEQVKAGAKALLKVGRQPDRSLMGISKGSDRKSGEEVLHFFDSALTLNLTTAPISMSFWTELRDEAHRTSNRFNAQRLSGSRWSNPFAKIPGIGPKAAGILRETYRSLKGMIASEPEDCENIKHLNKRQKAMLKAYIQANKKSPEENP
jgi:excinuclease ABC subunit C